MKLLVHTLTLMLLLAAPTRALDAPRSVAERDRDAAVTPEPAMVLPEDARPFTDDPGGAGIAIEGIEEDLTPFVFLTVTFPQDMVGADQIDAEDQASPVVFWPDLDVEFHWRTPTSGGLLVKGPVIPGQTYRLRLREGLTDAGGTPLPSDLWGATMASPPMQIPSSDEGWRDSLSARPQVGVEFNYPVKLSDAASHAWFQNRATRQKFPAEILLNAAEADSAETIDVQESLPDKIYRMRFRPIDPLPVGAIYDFVVDGIRDAYAGRSLPYPYVIPLGQTRPLKVEFVTARNPPLERPAVVVKFSSPLDESEPLSRDFLTVSPPVENLRLRTEGSELIAEGDFQIPGRYTVVVSDALRGMRGYGLEAPETWGATFHKKRGNILFPNRVVRQRSALGLNFAFYQINTGPLEWRLANIPTEAWTTVQQRLNEFDENLKDEHGVPLRAQDGFFKQRPTESLIEALALPTVASGTIDASGDDKETLREIQWKPQGNQPLGEAMLLEVTGQDALGRLVGNRAILLFGEFAITRKVGRTESTFRVAKLSDAMPVEGAEVSLLGPSHQVLATETTDSDGLATFRELAVAGATSVQARVGGSLTLQPLNLSQRFPGGYNGWQLPQPLRAYTFTDRPLYRPGQTVHFKGFVRKLEKGSLTVPQGAPIAWTIQQPYSRETLASGTATLDAMGAWNSEWTPPEGVRLGSFLLTTLWAGSPLGEAARFEIEEFRNPPFSVVCTTGESGNPAEATIQVASQYFHGAPNAGARITWKASWYADSDAGWYVADDATGMTRVDLYSKEAKHPTFFAEAEGQATLDASGKAQITCPSPFPDPANRASSQVSWRVDVTGPDGQTIPGGTSHRVAMIPLQIGVRTGDNRDGILRFEWDQQTPFGEASGPVQAKLFLSTTRSVRERLAPNVYRFRNFDSLAEVARMSLTAPGSFEFSPQTPGRYVLVLDPPSGSGGIPVSTEAYLPGPGEADLAVESESAAQVLSVSSEGRASGAPWRVGETAAFSVVAPSPGVAWVSVETDQILDTFTMPLSGNSARIEIPVKPEYEPNAFVSVYLLRPGGDDALAGEMFGYAAMQVEAPDRNLSISLSLAKPTVEPRQKILGEVTVQADGRPVAGADLTIYAVDDSILTLGGWKLPEDISRHFFPPRQFGVVTYSALDAYVSSISPSWLTAKGFVVGGAGEGDVGNTLFVRKEFKPLILWLPSVRTGPDGKAPIATQAPDNLGRFRFIAVGQTPNNQFGAGDTTIEVSKQLMVEPALPRFLRVGDDVELRAVVRQTSFAEASVEVRCEVSGDAELTSPSSLQVVAVKDTPTVVTFRAKATEVGKLAVTLRATIPNTSLGDATEVSLPVEEAVLLIKESVAGPAEGPTFATGSLVPTTWDRPQGRATLAVSSSPWLPQLLGIPFLLEYPHGCFEQKSSRLLVTTYLSRLLSQIPEDSVRKDAHAEIIQSTLREFESSLLPSGMLPYWPGGTEPSVFVTLQVAWCVLSAEQAGIEVPERLAAALPEAMANILEGRAAGSTPTLRAFALFLAASASEGFEEELKASVRALYAERDRLSNEGKALLALTLHKLGIQLDEQKQLVRELPQEFTGIAFHPETFASASRTEALCLWARLTIEPDADRKALSERLHTLLKSAPSLSTQENLWLLVAFQAFLEATPSPTLDARKLKPAGAVLSPDQTAAAWNDLDLTALAAFRVSGLPRFSNGSCVIQASFRPADLLTPLVSKGLRIERVLKNLTDPERTGTEDAPIKLGDELLISYRFQSDKPRSFVALEDLLPAGIEVLNPDLALFSRLLTNNPDEDVPTAPLSYSQMRDAQTNLYFDRFPEGVSGTSVLARATAVGTFIWPATQIYPMYDARTFGRSPSGRCVIKE